MTGYRALRLCPGEWILEGIDDHQSLILTLKMEDGFEGVVSNSARHLPVARWTLQHEADHGSQGDPGPDVTQERLHVTSCDDPSCWNFLAPCQYPERLELAARRRRRLRFDIAVEVDDPLADRCEGRAPAVAASRLRRDRRFAEAVVDFFHQQPGATV
jgi:hypothetical protein